MFGRTKKDATAVRVTQDTTTEHSGALTREHVVWAYRLLLDREPESEAVIGPKLAGSRDTSELRHHLMTSAEFQQKNRDYAHTNDRTIVIKELDGGPKGVRLFVDLSDHVIGLNIVRGRYEQDGIQYVKTVLKAGDTAVDAGAHIGSSRCRWPRWSGRLAGALRAARSERRPARAIDCRKQIQRSHRLRLQRAASARRRHRDAHISCQNLNSGGAYSCGTGRCRSPAT